MQPFDEMMAYVGFDPEDQRRLAEFWAHVEPRRREITSAFYDRILEFPGARAVFEDTQQVRRLQHTLEHWLEELLCGPHDQAYVTRRRRIGEKHVSVGLPHRYMFTAMQVLQEHLCEIAHEVYGPAEAREVCQATRRMTMLDLALMTDTFMGTREASGVGDITHDLLVSLPSMAFVVDHEGIVREATASARALCDSEPVGRPLSEGLPCSYAETLRLSDLVADAGAQGGHVTRDRVEVDTGDEIRTFRVTVAPLTRGGLQAVVLLDELTETLREEARRRRMEALAQLGELSAAVAHELRNPLAGISGAIQVIARSMEEDDRRRQVMGKVRVQIDRLDRMVRDLLEFSRPGDPEPRDLDLAEIADNVCDLTLSDEKAVAITRTGAGRAWADADQVHRIILNLVQNALAAAPDGGHVAVRVAEGRVEVADDGPGLPEGVRERVFEPFFTTKTTGTGLGLAICANSVAGMNGTLEAGDDEALGGACFVLTLPIEPEAAG